MYRKDVMGEAAKSIRPVRKTRVSDAVVIQLTQLIMDGAFSLGEKLPAERELAEQLEVNRTSLREALRKLETMGLVQIRPGDGVIVNAVDESAGLEFVRYLFSAGIDLDPRLMLEMAEIRQILAGPMIALAAERRSEKDLETLDQLVEEYAKKTPAERSTGTPDFEFFQAMAKATQNRVFIFGLNTVRVVFEKVSGVYYQIEGASRNAATNYAALVDAIRDQDKERAVKQFEEVMRFDDELLSSLLGNWK
jgi:GntR family transcriptional regulator, transcriptional repressor for pyruvate dehydrogenase complex